MLIALSESVLDARSALVTWVFSGGCECLTCCFEWFISLKTVITSNSYKLALFGVVDGGVGVAHRWGAASDSMLARWLVAGRTELRPVDAASVRGFVTAGSSVGAHAALDMDRCEDTSSLLQGYGLTAADKTTRTTSSPNQGPRHTIDHILGLARNNRDEGVTECRSETPGTGAESAGKFYFPLHICFIYFALQ